MDRSLIKGNILKNIAVFSLPYLLSFFLQTFYGMADLFIVGQFNGTHVIDAVSIGSQFMHFFTIVVVGLSVGSTVAIGHSTGAGDKQKISLEIGNTITLFAVVAVVLTIIMSLLNRNIVSLLFTPAEAVEDCVTYLRICFAGIPFIVAYNVISSIFRGMGNSKTPLYFVAVACVSNIALDYLFVGAFSMGARGAAFATVLAQLLSVLFSVIYIIRNKSFDITRKSLKADKGILGDILKNGVPIAAQEAFIQASFLVLTAIANNRGLIDSTAVGIVEKCISILFLVPMAMLNSVSVIGAQSLGAGDIKRAKATLNYALMIVWIFGAAVAFVMQFAGGKAVSLFTDDADVIRLGAEYMRGYVWDVGIAGTNFCFSGFFTACNKANYSFIHNMISVVCGRVPLAFLASAAFAETLFPMGLAISLGSSLSVIICIFLYRHLKKHSEMIRVI